MAEILIASLSLVEHVRPLLTVAQDLVARGNRVTVMTGSVHTAAIRAVGAHPHPLPATADVDDSSPQACRGRATDRRALTSSVLRPFLAPMPHQAAELAAAMAHTRFDAIVADCGFCGVIPMLVGDDADRPPVLYYSTTTPMFPSRDTAPAGMGLPPAHGRLGRLRDRSLNLLSQRVIQRRAHRSVNAMLSNMGVRNLPTFLLDVGVLADRFIVPTVPSFEYPRSDLAPNVHFVGAVHPRPSPHPRRPDWWRELDGARSVVHVTRGRLLAPTLDALGGDEEVIVVATTGGRDLGGALPSNVLVGERIPHDLLLPRVDVMVTDGGYGAAQRALSTGVPLVVAGDTANTREVAARIAWSGAGIDLRTGAPAADAIRRAVRAILSDGRYLRRARELECAFARRDGVAEIAALVDEVTRERRLPSHSRNSMRASWNP